MDSISRRTFVILGASAAIAPVVSQGVSHAFAATWEETVAAAKKEGQLQIYTTQATSIWDSVVAGFKAKYPGIEVLVGRNQGGALSVKLDQERQMGGRDSADFAMGTIVGWFVDRAREGNLVAPSGPSLANWPSEYIRDTSAVIVGADPLVLAYNTKVIKEPPTTYEILVRPEFKGRIALNEPAGGSSSIVLLDWWLKTYGEDFIAALEAQEPRYYTSTNQTLQAVASGEVDLTAQAYPSFADPIIAEGAPLSYVLPNPGIATPSAMGVLGWASRPNAALLMLDYCMSPEGQSLLFKTGVSPINAPGTMPSAGINVYDPMLYPESLLAERRKYWTARLMKR